MEKQLVLEVKGLTKKFGKGINSTTAVDGLNLRVEKGQVYGLLGPNGAGKTTTIKMISGMLRPDAGTISMGGHTLLAGMTKSNHLAIKSLGICPQELVVWDGLTVFEQLMFMSQMYDVPKKIAMERAHTLLEAMGLYDKKNKRGGTLSGGMKRRLNMMLGLMHDPDLLILDEPQAGLDPQSRVLIREYITNLSKHKTVLITTHDMEEADKICDRVAIVDQGKILIENTPALLKSHLFEGEFVEFELDNPFRINEDMLTKWRELYGKVSKNGSVLRFSTEKPVALIETLQAQMNIYGLTISDIKIRRAGLEDVFIELTGRGLRE